VDIYFRTDTTPEDDMISKELTKTLDDAINSLPNQCKIAFKLIREDNMKYKDAADLLNISVKTLEAHITKAIKELRLALKTKS
jgi:RNA polymerase sigma-70 factor (ECF subfamily)